MTAKLCDHSVFPPARTRHLPRAAAVLSVLMLAGCANFNNIPAGTPIGQVVSHLGQPAVTCPADGGGEWMLWTQQPYGQTAWRTRVVDGHTGPMQPALTDAHFDTLRTGTWTQQDVRCAFGPPAEISYVGLPSVRQLVWSYRYRQAGVWNSLMFVYFGTDGHRVTQAHPGPDPLYDPQEWPFGH